MVEVYVIKVGIVGIGFIGFDYLYWLIKIVVNVDVIVVCDIVFGKV